MAAHLLRFSPLPSPKTTSIHHRHHRFLLLPTSRSPLPSSHPLNLSLSLPLPRATSSSSLSGGSGSGTPPGGGSNGWGGGGGGSSGRSNGPDALFFPLGLFLNGWRSRVAADPQFPFKVLMEELVGVSACVLGDMATRPNFGLHELDFVFCTLVVGSILNFVLMYLLAPTAAATISSASLPGVFSRCPPGHMFELGPYTPLHRLGTFAYKGAVFGAVGFFAGLTGTAISNGLIALRKRVDPGFEPPNKPPPTVLNSLTWALHMGLSSNFRYQTLNGIEFLLARAVSPAVLKTSVVVLRCANNVLGGMSFVVLARLTGSQKAGEETGKEKVEEEGRALLEGGGEGEMREGEGIDSGK